MDSGIYKLVFASGNFYIGKSEHIQKRWKTHEANFLKGTHTKKMQAEYNISGAPSYEVLLPVHADHIDIYESILIDRHWGDKCLNTTRPKSQDFKQASEYLEYYDQVTINNESIMLLSTLEHIKAMINLSSNCDELKATNVSLNEELDELVDAGIKLPETWKQSYEELANEADALRIMAREQMHELYRLKKLSLLDRIFNYIVYV
jgi:hypothetical protein